MELLIGILVLGFLWVLGVIAIFAGAIWFIAKPTRAKQPKPPKAPPAPKPAPRPEPPAAPDIIRRWTSARKAQAWLDLQNFEALLKD